MAKYYNEKCQAWCALDEETQDAIRASDCVEHMGGYGEWSKSTMKGVFCSGGIFRAPIEPKQIPLGPEDIKQGDAVRYKGGKNWSTIDIYEDGVIRLWDKEMITFEGLMNLHEIRSIGETEWRECSKENK